MITTNTYNNNSVISPTKRILLSLGVFSFIALNLSMIQLKVHTKMLLLERFFSGGGWLEIVAISSYGAILVWLMTDSRKSAKWRSISWTIFSVWFFLQLFLGIFVNKIFLLTGKLHLPIPAIMLGGPLYRGQLSIMTFLFLSTIILSGSAWCSHLCYFGAIDNQMAKRGKAKAKPMAKNRMAIKSVILFIVIITALIMRWFDISPLISTIAGLIFGFIGLGTILFLSKKKGKMVHCVMYCPIGTIVNYFRFVNPFRMTIDATCTHCMACSSVCRYDALNVKDIKNNKPGITCTLCGDCISSCHAGSLQYKFFIVKPDNARIAYLFITVSLHAIFLAMGRI